MLIDSSVTYVCMYYTHIECAWYDYVIKSQARRNKCDLSLTLFIPGISKIHLSWITAFQTNYTINMCSFVMYSYKPHLEETVCIKVGKRLLKNKITSILAEDFIFRWILEGSIRKCIINKWTILRNLISKVAVATVLNFWRWPRTYSVTATFCCLEIYL